MLRANRAESKSAPWRDRAGELADWALSRLVNRPDAWGAYHPGGGQLTRRGRLTGGLLVRHFRAEAPGAILGAHTADADNQSKGGALDIDQHGDDPVRAEANRLAALHWYGVLARTGFRPLLADSNGKGGYHLRILLSEPVPADRLYRFLRHLTRDHRRHGLDKPPEQFPKQPDVRRCAKGLGNWLRLPGRHHKREFWSTVWDGGQWLDGAGAVAFLLSLPGDPPALVPDVPPPPPPPRRWQRIVSDGGHNLSARIARYMARLPNLAEGQGRDDVAFSFACFLVRDLALDDGLALDWLRRWDAGNSPPKGDARLAEVIKSARAYGQRPIGCGLPAGAPRRDRRGHFVLKATGEVY